MYALHEGIVCTSRNSTCSNNELDHYTDNAITYGSNNLLIRGNYIHDPIDVGLSYHMDAMQGEGQPLPAGHTSLTWNNVVIDSNIIVEHNDPKNQWLQQTNGFDDYSGVPYLTWNNLRVTNNLYVGASVNGIFFSGIANSLIGDNILINNGYAPRTPPPDINLGPSPLNNNVRICNNIAPIIVARRDQGVTLDHNIATTLFAYSIQNADGTFAKNPTWFRRPASMARRAARNRCDLPPFRTRSCYTRSRGSSNRSICQAMLLIGFAGRGFAGRGFAGYRRSIWLA